MQLPITGAPSAKKITLSDEIFARPLNKALLAQAVRAQLNNQRSANSHTKKRGEVSGGGRKPWRQKGTGRARVGSSRTPLWRGGGIIFGPSSERNYALKLPAKMAKQALYQALSLKAKEGRLFVIADLKLDAPSTKSFLAKISELGIQWRDALLVLGSSDKTLRLSARNIVGLQTTVATSVSTYDILRAETLILTESALIPLQGEQKPREAKSSSKKAVKAQEATNE